MLPQQEPEKGKKWDVLSALLVMMAATMPLSCALWSGLALGSRQQGTGVCGETDSSAGSYFLLGLTSRQKLALWGSCRSANPWHTRDTEEDAGQILYKKPSPHALLSLGGWTEGSPLSDFMLLCSSQGKSNSKLGKATFASHRRKEKTFPSC